MGNYFIKNQNSIENIEISIKKNILIIINGIIDLNFICFIKIDRNLNFKIKSFNDISKLICMMTYNNITHLEKQRKLLKKFDNLVYSFKIMNNNKIYTYDKLCACFIFSLRIEIHKRLSHQFLEQDKAALNSLLYRIKDIYPEK